MSSCHHHQHLHWLLIKLKIYMSSLLFHSQVSHIQEYTFLQERLSSILCTIKTLMHTLHHYLHNYHFTSCHTYQKWTEYQFANCVILVLWICWGEPCQSWSCSSGCLSQVHSSTWPHSWTQLVQLTVTNMSPVCPHHLSTVTNVFKLIHPSA